MKHRILLTFQIVNVKLARISCACDTSKAFKFTPAEGVQPLVSGRVLDEPGLVAEPVVAVLSHAMKVSLMLAIVATRETAVLIEPIVK